MLKSSENPIRAHNQPAAGMWNAGGAAYDMVSFAISDALAHAAQRLAPRPGASILDIATGTGWTARNCARMGAKVTAIDIADELLSAARILSAGMEPPIRFVQADAEALPFGNAEFDGVISTFGVMFAGDQQTAAAELARVCRPGGRLVLATWTPGGSVAEFFGVIGKYVEGPPPAESPMNWGDPDWISGCLGDDFDLVFEEGRNHAHHESIEAIWNWYLRGFGPIRSVHDQLDEARKAAFRRDVDAFHARYETPAGLRVGRDYLVTIGRRK